MIIGELKSKIDSLWELFWTGGLTNPLDVVEQMTYLMFIHDLDDTDNLHAKESAYSKYMDDAIFKIPTPLMLSKVVDSLDNIYAQMAAIKDADVRGDVYEYLLSKIASAGVNGQFRTPRHIIKMMVDMMAPQPDDVICEGKESTLIQCNRGCA